MSTAENKLAIFDLDGVLVDSKNFHFEALNQALGKLNPKFIISEEEHSLKYDGLSTRKKLELLSIEKQLPNEVFTSIWNEKQKITEEFLEKIPKDLQLIELMNSLSSKNIKLAVASNSIKSTVKKVLMNLGIFEFMSIVFSNEDVDFPKPHPEIYWKTMAHFGAIPENTFIFEDSYVGRLAALRSGAHLIPVDNRKALNFEKIVSEIFHNSIPKAEKPWKSDSLNVLIPMAGAGSRFESAGYTFPKPLIEVNGKPMIQVVVENLNIDARYIYIVQKEHFVKYNLDYLLQLITPNCDIIQVDGLTEGAACTTLLARDLINNDRSLLIANSDQFVEWSSGEVIYSFMAEDLDGGIVTFNSTHPKWSFVKVNDSGIVMEVAEKKPISSIATAGIYFWKKGSDYVKFADKMIVQNERVNGEFYVCPVFNYAIRENKKFRIKEINKMWGLGTPEDLKNFLDTRN
jgi:beta-phosphoglucomutase-like phosphatase (HAD superfamily)/dTDP-glucose pyrophosphorylase